MNAAKCGETKPSQSIGPSRHARMVWVRCSALEAGRA